MVIIGELFVKVRQFLGSFRVLIPTQAARDPEEEGEFMAFELRGGRWEPAGRSVCMWVA